MRRAPRIAEAAVAALLLGAPTVLAHVNPPLVLLSDRDAMTAVLPAATQFPEAQVDFSPEQKRSLQKEWRFKAEEGSYRFYEGRDAGGRVVGSVIFLTQATIHSPVRVAVGVGKDGRVTGAAVVEVSEESYNWIKPLIDQGFLKAYVGQSARGEFKVSEAATAGRQRLMRQFYAKVIAQMVQTCAALHETADLKQRE